MSAPAFSVALSFEDGVTRFITCRTDQTVADASYQQRINIPLDCRDGACGTCKALCTNGSYDGGRYLEDALSRAEAAAGYVLPCQMRPRSNLVMLIAGTSESARTKATTYTGTLTQLESLSATTVKLRIDIPNRNELEFLPGQYVNIAVPGTDQVRSYSFCNSPRATRLTFLIKLTPGGAMSQYLTHRAAVGDRICFTGPHGCFFLREGDRSLLLLAGGTGLAPILAMLHTMGTTGDARRTHLIYGVSTDDDLVALDEIGEIASASPAFTWDYCVYDPASTAPNKGPDRGVVTSLIEPGHLNGGDVAIYLCGPPPMVEAVRAYVTTAQGAPQDLYYEKFTPAPRPSGSLDRDDPHLYESGARRIAGQLVFPPRQP